MATGGFVRGGLGGAGTGATVGFAAGGPIGAGVGAGVGFVIGGVLGSGQEDEADEEAKRAEEEQRRIAIQSEVFQSQARAQRLALLTEGRRFADDGPSQPSSQSALAPLAGAPTASGGNGTPSAAGNF